MLDNQFKTMINLQKIKDDNQALAKASKKKPTALWTFYHSLIVIELGVIIAIELYELLKHTN